MKKLIMMAVAASAVSVQAAQILWNSGTPLKQPINGTGNFGAINITSAGGQMNIWFFTSLALANDFVDSGYTAGTFFASTLTGTLGQTLDTTAPTGGYSGTSANSFALSTQYFTVAYVETTITGNANPVLNNTWYMYSGVETFTTQATGNTTINFGVGTGLGLPLASQWPSNWTPVPEPATGALALAGAALLLRRRRRA